MRIAPEARRRPVEPMLPLINVVFLLLIFLLLMGRVEERAKITVTPAEATQTEPARAVLRLHVDAAGEVAFGAALGEEAVLAALATALVDGISADGDLSKGGPARPVAIRADAGADLAKVLRLARAVRGAGASAVMLEVRTR
ncbi:biopolymer transporter ExbD [Stappia indica]|uniref:biopolymer transporter ExbD n=1 Tax=Stappia indica TaxID=538381 RepID=UPI001CD48D00|nr:biopolymer transporter ExbD [Stappia indica]MCA1300521.1 biopolymer transporter ExbD [Stappia indica]